MIIIMVLLAVAALVFQAAGFGPMVTADSANYLATAESLAAGAGFISFDGPYVYWPPLVPMLLAPAHALGIDPVVYGFGLNLLSFLALALVARAMLSAVIESPALRLLGVAMVVFSPAWWSVVLFVGSDAIFTALCAATLLGFVHYLSAPNWCTLLIAAILSALACLAKYIGVTLPLTFGVLLLFTPLRWQTRLVHLIAYGVVACTPTFAWLLRNFLGHDTLTGPRFPPQRTLSDTLEQSGMTVMNWLLPHQLPSVIHLALALVLAVLLIVFLGGRYRHSRLSAAGTLSSESKHHGSEERGGDAAGNAVLIVLTVFLAIYFALFAWLASRAAFDAISDRFLVPVLLPFVALVVYLAERLARILQQRWRGVPFTRLLCGLLLLWLLAYPVVSLVVDTRYRLAEGAGGYSTAFWRDNSLVTQLEREWPEGQVFSNAPDYLYVTTGQAADFAPRRHQYQSPQSPGDTLAGYFERQTGEPKRSSSPANEASWLIWVSDKQRSYLYPLADIEAAYQLEVAYRSEDGVIARIVGPRETPVVD